METEKTAGGERGAALYRRFTALAVALTAAMAVSYVAWTAATQSRIAEQTALVEARAMSAQMGAAWDYVDSIQTVINFDADGEYCFKGIYCATAAKQIAEEVTGGDSGYSVRYVRRNPRNIDDLPDDFEMRALEEFGSSDATEYYGITEYGGTEAFRYVARLDMLQNCLECHGKPAGSRDPTGGYREGKSLGDLAGACSIVVPLDAFRAQAIQRTVTTLVFFGIMLALFVVCVRWALARWVVGPLNETNAQLERANEAKSDFLTLMSHELRTPLSSIIAFTDIWEKQGPSDPDTERYLVGEIRGSSEVMLGLVNNLIDAAKLDGGKYELTFGAVDVCDVCDVAKSLVEPLALSKNVRVRIAGEDGIPLVTADWEALRKVITNLLCNAVKFTDDGGVVETRVRYDASSACIVVEVIDTGCGIAPADLLRVFDRFEQAGEGGRQGSGLGLSISKGLIEMMGGTIGVESELGVGSTFTVRLPVVSPTEKVDGMREKGK